jgi:phosphoglycerol transferase MdoB-like AlkP superfamily enzyme
MVFDSLPEIAKMPEAKFVFVHLLLPHPPFGFDAEGNSINPAEVDFKAGYTNQATYFGDEIIKTIDIILKESETPPIIIIQGDHGPPASHPEQHLGILNAYYLPKDTTSLYPTITPVNTFRLILSEYFGENYPLLPDESYSLETNNNYDFTYIKNTCEE